MANSKDEKREAILKAAFEAFKTYGLKKMTLEDVAAKVGMATSSLYYYFDSKKKLFMAVVEQEVEKVFQAKQEAMAKAGTTEEKFHALWSAVGSTLDELGELTANEMKNIQEGIWEAREFIAKWQAEHERITQGILERGVEEGIFEVKDIRQTAFLFATTMRGLFSELVTMGRLSEIQWAAKEIVNLFLQGIKKR